MIEIKQEQLYYKGSYGKEALDKIEKEAPELYNNAYMLYNYLILIRK